MFARLAVVGLALAALPACGTLYLAQAARGQWQVMHERRPIDTVVADPRTPALLRARLIEVREARDFASRELGLPDNASYRSYADVGRPFVLWNVVAAPEFSVEPQRWCFPIAGCVAYRGYFIEQQARAFAASRHARGFDVMVGGVPAYSTLGRIADPVLNTMLGYGDTELAAMIFHELAHQVVYVAGDSSFNEAFAVTVEQAGLKRWLNSRGREAELGQYEAAQARQRDYVALIMRRRAELQHLYREKLAVAEMRKRKKALLGQLATDIAQLAQRPGSPSPYAAWAAQDLNNAYLASVATYFNCVPGFERLLSQQGGNLRAFYAAVRHLAGQPRAERQSQLCARPD